MASGHHAEITKDLNGFTVRDLGSTNGTLVNGDPITEILLKHGDRVRVGNARFVFKDPSMKDIDIGRRGRGRRCGRLGHDGRGRLRRRQGWRQGPRRRRPARRRARRGRVLRDELRSRMRSATFFDVANLIGRRDLRLPRRAFLVRGGRGPAHGGARDDGRHTEGRRRTSSSGAPIPGGAGAAVAAYAEELGVKENTAYRIAAQHAARRHRARGAGDPVEPARKREVGFDRRRRRPCASGMPDRTGQWTKVERIVRRPSWAKSGRLVLVVGPDASVRIDDVRFEDEAAGRCAGAEDRGRQGHRGRRVVGGQRRSRAKRDRALLVGASPWARFADGRGGRRAGGLLGGRSGHDGRRRRARVQGPPRRRQGRRARVDPMVEDPRGPLGGGLRRRRRGGRPVGRLSAAPTWPSS